MFRGRPDIKEDRFTGFFESGQDRIHYSATYYGYRLSGGLIAWRLVPKRPTSIKVLRSETILEPISEEQAIRKW
ncbi:hypothetical protein KKG41_00650 [Patescibacteria group bacterium]|nr:hypothetical protein [Patescibacteria group bacterium]MBU1890749.1 hypothetical protein [Patescibacteria group bacterium]